MSAYTTRTPATATGSVASSYICVLDFEATCDDKVRLEQEIIQFPSVLLALTPSTDASKPYIAERISEIDIFVKPRLHPKLTTFCTELTGITQDRVDGGIDIAAALEAHTRWLCEHTMTEYVACSADTATATTTTSCASTRSMLSVETELKRKVLIVTCGDWDLKTMLPTQLAREGIRVPSHLQRWHNVKVGFEFCMGGKRPRGMTDMLAKLGLRLEGRHHNGLDDCRNITNIVSAMVKRGYELMPTSEARKPRR